MPPSGDASLFSNVAPSKRSKEKFFCDGIRYRIQAIKAHQWKLLEDEVSEPFLIRSRYRLSLFSFGEYANEQRIVSLKPRLVHMRVVVARPPVCSQKAHLVRFQGGRDQPKDWVAAMMPSSYFYRCLSNS